MSTELAVPPHRRTADDTPARNAAPSASSPIAVALVMLAVYVAMYLTVAGVMQVIDWGQR